MRREKRHRQKVPFRSDPSEPDISDIIPVVEYTPIVVPERLRVETPFEADDEAAATEELINEQRLNDDAILGLAVSISASAQDAISFLNEANSQIRSAGSIIYQVVIAVLAIVAIVSLITVGIKMYSGDQESAQKALGWCGGMVFCIIAALVLKNFIGL